MAHRLQVEPTRLQYLALQLSEKAGQLVESNEKLLDGRAGYSYKGEKRGQDRGGRPFKPRGGREEGTGAGGKGKGGNKGVGGKGPNKGGDNKPRNEARKNQGQRRP